MNNINIALLKKEFDINTNVLALKKDGQIKAIARKDRFAVFKAWLGGELDSKRICDAIGQADITGLEKEQRDCLDKNLTTIASKFSKNESKKQAVELSMNQLRRRISNQYPVRQEAAKEKEKQAEQFEEKEEQAKQVVKEVADLFEDGVDQLKDFLGIDRPPAPVEAKSEEEEEIYQLVCRILDQKHPEKYQETLEYPDDSAWRAGMGFPDAAPLSSEQQLCDAVENVADRASGEARILVGRMKYTAQQVSSMLPDSPDMSSVQLPSVPDFELPDMPSVQLPSVPDFELPAGELRTVPAINTAPVEEVANQILGFCNSVIEQMSGSQEPETKAAQEAPFWWKDSKKTRKTRTPEIAEPAKPAANAVPYEEPDLAVPTEVYRSTHFEEDAVEAEKSMLDAAAEMVPSVDTEALMSTGSAALGALTGWFASSPVVPQTLEEVQAELQKAEKELAGINATLINMRSVLGEQEIVQMEQEQKRLDQWIVRLKEQEIALTTAVNPEPSVAAQAFKAFTGWTW